MGNHAKVGVWEIQSSLAISRYVGLDQGHIGKQAVVFLPQGLVFIISLLPDKDRLDQQLRKVLVERQRLGISQSLLVLDGPSMNDVAYREC